MSAAAVVDDLRAKAADLRSRDSYSEADTIRRLIDPVLDFVGYPESQRGYEPVSKHRGGGNRPDIAIWEEGRVGPGMPATAIIEVKRLGADLNGKGKSRLDRPKEQIARYTTGCSFSGAGTLGILTDGNVWHLVRAGKNRDRALAVGEFRLLDGPAAEASRGLEEIRRFVAEAAGAPPQPVVAKVEKARELADAVAEGQPPKHLLRLLADPERSGGDLKAEVSLEGKHKYAESGHWGEYAFGPAGRIDVDQTDIEGSPACAAVVRMSNPDPVGGAALHRGDVATAAAAFAKSVSSGVAVVLAVTQPDEPGAPVSARLAVRHRGHTGMTVEFDPHAPPPPVLRSIQRIQAQLREPGPVQGLKLAEAVSPAGVQKAFYDSVSKWVLRQYSKASGGPDQRRRRKEAVLRHLIRILFAWILKEDGKLPQEVFDQAFAGQHAPGTYHRDVLAFLFHERLNKPADRRSAHPVEKIEDAMRDVAFLNGSLFAVHDGDEDLSIPDKEYFGTGGEGATAGLFETFSVYDWTSSEHLPAHSEQAVDPEVLGSLFENLIAVTESDDTLDRMPKGTYYTPPDVAQEMVADSLMLAVRGRAPKGWTEQDLLDLFRDPDAPAPLTGSKAERDRLADRIEELTVFDPCVGSGVFLVCALHSIRTALDKLRKTNDPSGRNDPHLGEMTRRIVTRQLHAQDVNPMAAQITRLRLFIALIAAEPDGLAGPLPNLEARVVCADTLSTDARRDWTPSSTGTLQDSDTGVINAVRARGEIFAEWMDAHDEHDKTLLRDADDHARGRLTAACGSAASAVTPETEAFARHRLLDPDAGPVSTDARLLFDRIGRTGFDIVIGNPPYVRIPAVSAAQFGRLHYKTTNCHDLYTLIAEAALALAAADEGVLTLIVPLSLCFGQRQSKLREAIEAASREIRARSHDNAPDTTFNESPVATPNNSQRVTIFSAVTSTAGDKPRILVTGTGRWPTSQRHSFLKTRNYIPKPPPIPKLDTRLDTQWDRIPTSEISDMIAAMRSSQTKIRDLRHIATGSEHIGLPKSARYFVTTTPAGRLKRRESVLTVGDRDGLLLAIAAANSHPAYAWWKAYGDAFDVKPVEIETIAIPDTWINHTPTRQHILLLANQLIEGINADTITIRNSGGKHKQLDSINLHEHQPDTIAEIDNLYITGLSLKPEPLLGQLRDVRQGATSHIV